MKEKIDLWNEQLGQTDAEQVLAYFIMEFKGKMCLSSSMGAEDQLLTDMLVRIDPGIRIITLDTGRLFPETLDLMHKTRQHYNISLEVYFPEYQSVQKMVYDNGVNLFYDSVENRQMCCHIRKIEPLKRALQGMQAWITGIRKDQTLKRFNTRLVEWDEEYGLVKISPLYRWSEKMVWDYIRQNQVPYNPLHDRNFPSIGCQPCTRSIKTGEDSRAGRWWWEDQGHKECGLHNRELFRH
jgi:phosphoadenosine phosphosulfate reductase